MCRNRVVRRSLVLMALPAVWSAGVALAQSPSPPPEPPQHEPQTAQEPDHAGHHPPSGEPLLFATREASGTAWVPAATPMYAIHQRAGAWQLMWHGTAFVQFLEDGGDRGSRQVGSINWIMGMARRSAAGGTFGVRGMASLEPWTIPGCGYPDLLATGETCDGEAIHDRQHPHDLVMELAVDYERPIRGALRWQLYGGLAGEPALGPAAFPHRVSAMGNPLAPIAHHWLDATHLTFGVVTAGLGTDRWKVEASVFNGREPDERRWDLDLARFDSVSGRVTLAPSPGLVLQVSAGHLAEAEAGHEGGPRVDVDRVTASAIYHRSIGADSHWATTIGWGRNVEAGQSSHGVLVETSLTHAERHVWFARFEVAGKSAHDLDIHESDDQFVVSKLQGGYVRYLHGWRGLQPGFGGGVSASVVPPALEPVYGRRLNPGVSAFVTLRPAAHRM